MLTIDQREMTVPGSGAPPGDGGSSFRRILVPVRAPGEAYPALAVAARICGLANGVLRLVHVRACDSHGPAAQLQVRHLEQTGGPAATPSRKQRRRPMPSAALSPAIRKVIP